MAVEGMRKWGDGNQAMQVIDMSRDIALIQPIRTPFFSLLVAAGKVKETESPEWYHSEGDYLATTALIDGPHLISETELNFVDASMINVGDVLRITRLHENVHVTGKNGNTVDTVRDIGGTGAGAALIDQDEVIVISSSKGEGADPHEAIVADYLKVDGYVQEFSTSIEQSDVQMASTGVPGSDLRSEQNKKGEEHKRKIERAAFYSKIDKETISGKIHRYTDGLRNRISTYVSNIGGAMSKAEFDAFCKGPMSYGSENKYLFCANEVYEAIVFWAKDYISADMVKFQMPDGGEFGFRVRKYLSPYGDVNIIRNASLFKGNYAGTGFLVDMDQCWWRPMKGLDTQLREKILPRAHGELDEWFTCGGFMIQNEKCHGYLYGVTGGE